MGAQMGHINTLKAKMADHVNINPGFSHLKFESMGIKVCSPTKDKAYYMQEIMNKFHNYVYALFLLLSTFQQCKILYFHSWVKINI